MPRKRRIHPLIFIILFLLLLAGGIVGGAMYWWNDVQKPVDLQNQEVVKIIIPKGSGVINIAQILKDNNLIKNEWGFRLYVTKKNMEGELQAGSYSLNQSMDLAQIAQKLTEGKEDFWVTIPEGKRREEIAQILSEAFADNGVEFSVSEFMSASEGLEGYLFPETYLFPKYITTPEVVEILRSTFDEKIPDELKIKANDMGLTFQEVMILASLVEREAKYEVDRPKIARVLLNRLDIGMALQVDATIQYALGSVACAGQVGQDCNWWPVVTDTKFKSPYNTYLTNELPPAPICNPGQSVIEAVLNAPDHDYMYYLAEPSGKTHYAKTKAEHDANIEEYLNY
ncbi:endolytic transglycosylase MltG [Candidatus Beckwithbacteria bacterium]|nr:endolytic transglycosylase MltG [Candidatus Beckwithbacteria bacterium]